MKMTQASTQYFAEVAEQWDGIRSGYFTEKVREAAMAKAYLRPDMIVADVGSGTGFMAAGLAPCVRQVHVIDGSAAMLDVARRNLAKFENIFYHEADGTALPLPDGSVDAVFANMYLHHCPAPLLAIREMARILRPGGRLVITDSDAHPYEWLKEEMADVWLGFERPQVRDWFKEAGLVNVILDCTGQSCCAESQSETITDEKRRQATISVFVAVGTKPVSGMRAEVKKRYHAAAKKASCCGGEEMVSPEGSSCCGGQKEVVVSKTTSCCGGGDEKAVKYNDLDYVTFDSGYSASELAGAPLEAAEISLGCGNPTAMAGLQSGEVVLDIGSGGGLDSFLAARQVGANGKVIGVDMTKAMLERAQAAAAKAGLSHVEFRYGHAESLPVEDSAVDVILSNCVINLCEDKGRVFDEAYRVLRDGGRLEISDMVTDGSFPVQFLADAQEWSECIAGALPENEYLNLVAQAGFTDIITHCSASGGKIGGVNVYSVQVSARKRKSGCGCGCS